MSLYYEAAPLIASISDSDDSLKSRVFGSKELKSQPKQVYALVSEAAKWSPFLAGVIERSQLLQLERKLSPHLALLLVHDLLVKKGISAPATHPLRLSVEKHKARLSAEFTRARLRRGLASIEDLQADIGKGFSEVERKDDGGVTRRGDQTRSQSTKWSHPRWVRVNTLKTTLGEQMRTTFAGYNTIDSFSEFQKLSLQSTEKLLHVDGHIPNLIALSPKIDPTKMSAYQNGLIIIQDKASCFPAYLLDPKSRYGPTVDACAAPGNKTTHLAAILQDEGTDNRRVNVYACERDQSRTTTLTQMVQKAGASGLVSVKKGQDFLRTEPEKAPWNDVGYLLLDPSCSGSGIITRGETLKFVLPSKVDGDPSKNNSKKRKRKANEEINANSQEAREAQEETPLENSQPSEQLSARLSALSTFQLKLLLHAFSFPKAHRITYSTCSVYAEENEQVVVKALSSDLAAGHGWRILPRKEQVAGMKSWKTRGDLRACSIAAKSSGIEEIAEIAEVAEACVRCEKDTIEGTQGFFVAAFVRDEERGTSLDLSDQEWEGFGDDET